MIFDKLTSYPVYFQTSEMKSIIEDVIQNYSIKTKDGTYQEFDHYYIKVMSPETLEVSDIIESHQKEIDIQILLSGTEKIRIFSEESVTIKSDYNPEIDCTFYTPNSDPHSEVILQPGYFAMFFPQDIHNPLIAYNTIQSLKKIVVKLDVNWYKSLKS
jgi:YhcH/YjgK/YiaL family protein